MLGLVAVATSGCDRWALVLDPPVLRRGCDRRHHLIISIWAERKCDPETFNAFAGRERAHGLLEPARLC